MDIDKEEQIIGKGFSIYSESGIIRIRMSRISRFTQADFMRLLKALQIEPNPDTSDDVDDVADFFYIKAFEDKTSEQISRVYYLPNQGHPPPVEEPGEEHPSEQESEIFDSAFSHQMERIKESRARMHSLQQEIDAYKKQAHDLITNLQGA